MLNAQANGFMKKLPTGIPGFDLISHGGLPQGRSTLISGTAGSAKTVMAAQFLAEGILKSGDRGVFITFEESPSDIRRNMQGFGWDIANWEAEGKWLFVDASPDPKDDAIIAGDYDLGALLARIEFAVRKVGATRVSMDSIGAVFTRFSDVRLIRGELFRVTALLKSMGVTALVTSERVDDYGHIARYGVEEFVTDNVIILRNVLAEATRRRTIEILKFRGTVHQKGEFPFTVVPGLGMTIIPMSAMELKQKSTDTRITSGNPELDRMCGGGLFQDSVILVSGATGTGKTLLATQFIDGGANHNERCLLFAFEESQEQLFRNAHGWGVDFPSLVDQGSLRVVCEYPEAASLEDHLIQMKAEIDRYQPARVVVDSLSALNRISTAKGFREFVISLTSFVKAGQIVGLFTATTPTLLGGSSVTEAHFSTITDSIILLRYVEMFGEMRRGITVLKMRGSMHEKQIREFIIDGTGMHIGNPFRNVTGILVGALQHIASNEIDRFNTLFQEDAGPQL